MGSDFSRVKVINKLAILGAVSLLLAGCTPKTSSRGTNENSSQSFPKTSETSSALSLASTSANGFSENETALMKKTLAGVVLPYAIAPSYSLKAENVSSVDGISYEFTSDHYLSLKDSYFALLQQDDFALLVTEIDDSDPYYIARKSLKKEVHVDVNFLVEENHLKAFAYLYDNSANVSTSFPNGALEKDLGYTLPVFQAASYLICYNLTSDYRYRQVDITADEIESSLASYQNDLTAAGFGDFSVSSDYLLASKGPIRLMVYIDGTSALLRTSTTDKPA